MLRRYFVCSFFYSFEPDFSLSQIDRLLKGPFTDRQGYFNYREWVKVLRVNQDEEDSK